MKRGLICIIAAVFAIIAVCIALIVLHIDFWIVWAVLFGCFVLLLTSELTVIYLLDLKLSRLQKAADYDGVIDFGSKYAKWCWGARESAVCMMVAVGYFSKKNDEKFLEELAKVTHANVQYHKFYWLTVYYLLAGDRKNAQIQYDSYLKAKQGKDYQKLAEVLNGLFGLDGDTQEEINTKAENLMQQLNNPRVKEFISEKLNKI